MAPQVLRRHYPVPNLNFRDFWDICSHFMRVHEEHYVISYTLDGREMPIVSDENDISFILKKLSLSGERVVRYRAKFYPGKDSGIDESELPELQYHPVAWQNEPMGLSFRSPRMSKLALYEFETLLNENYGLGEAINARIEFGKPCEILTAMIDLRGFSVFCEKPNIESPYTCGLMSAFYSMVQLSFSKYPPEMIKFLGDGVLVTWETTHEDREVAINTCLEGSVTLNGKWRVIRKSPQFSHGAPEDIGVGVSFGLASILTVGNDYIGRPINLATRLCQICNGGEILVDKALPSMPQHIEREDYTAHIRSFGRASVWRLFGE